MNKKSLVAGKTYYFLIEAWNINSEVTVLRYDFIVNLPPYGGECNILPDTGNKYKYIMD